MGHRSSTIGELSSQVTIVAELSFVPGRAVSCDGSGSVSPVLDNDGPLSSCPKWVSDIPCLSGPRTCVLRPGTSAVFGLGRYYGCGVKKNHLILLCDHKSRGAVRRFHEKLHPARI